MEATGWFLVVVAIVGFLISLYGANYYDPLVGWIGVWLFLVSVIGLLLLYAYDELAKRRRHQNP